jgi:hypothetical protein
MPGQYFIRRDFADIFPHLAAIRAQADSERDALGFLPEPAYAESARQRKLILLLSRSGPKEVYVGHLLFGGIFPNLRVRQICVAPTFRHQGHGTTLLPRHHFKMKQYLSESATAVHAISGPDMRLVASRSWRNVVSLLTMPAF